MLNSIIRDCGVTLNQDISIQDNNDELKLPLEVDAHDYPPRDYSGRVEPPKLWEFDYRDRYKKREKRPAKKEPAVPDDFKARYEELTAHGLEPDAYTLSVAHSSETWNVDGLEPRLKKNLPDMQAYAR